MAKPSSNRRLFQADGYTFIRWIEEQEVETMLAAGEVTTCFDPRTDRAIGFQLTSRQTEGASDSSSILPFSRPTHAGEKFHYEIPYYGDCRSVCMRRFGLSEHSVIGAGTKTILLSRTLKVSARKIDLTAAAYLTPTRTLSSPAGPASSLNSPSFA